MMSARHCVDDGNKLLLQRNISGAIDKYNQAIRYHPYYAIPHYNKRIAVSMQSDTNYVENEEGDFNQLINKAKNLSLAGLNSTFFVMNTIAGVPEYPFSDDSSDEESDEEFNILYEKEYYSMKSNFFPYSASPSKCKTEMKIPDKKLSDLFNSRVVEPFLKKVVKNGLEVFEQDKLSMIATSVGLNRMHSLSKRKNESLILELESKINTTEIKYEIFGFYWSCDWYNKDGKKVDIKVVRSFYKKLKAKNPDLAKKFIEQEEKEKAECKVPYQYIREYAKNHPKTKKIIQEFRENNSKANIYLHLVDVDVRDFNGIYSAFMRIINHCYKPPTVMSTGYEFPKDTQHMAHHLLGHMERMHRVITTFFIPLGTYYPEPNMCILIPENSETVEESFIDRARGNGRTLESPILLANIQNNRKNVYALFSDDNPIITNIPSRCKTHKQGKKSRNVEFSPEFNKGPFSPTRNDIKKYDEVSQSHSSNLTWSSSLFINHCIKYDKNYETDGESINDKNNKPLKGVDKQCKKLIGNIRKNIDVELLKSKLANRIGVNNAYNIVNAIETINQYNEDFNKKYARTTEEQELIDITKDREICFTNLSRESLLMIVNSPIMKSIKDDTIGFQNLIDLDEEMLEYISNSDSIIQALEDKECDFDDLIDCLQDNLEEFDEALLKYSVGDIVKCYKEDPLHLRFMAGDPLNIVYEDSDDYEIVNFAIKHQYIDDEDIYEIRNELLGDRDESAAHQDFERILMSIYEERYNNEYSDVESVGDTW